ncbi:MAG: hypothetical protein DMG49_01485 [Acidobacteria bacterium]|nr:MAG: hypothetical protein DMG49_01485 [Acidobacteriota bacterium]
MALFSSETRLPFWRSSTKPALLECSNDALTGDTRQLWLVIGMSRGFGGSLRGQASGFEVELDRFKEGWR